MISILSSQFPARSRRGLAAKAHGAPGILTLGHGPSVGWWIPTSSVAARLPRISGTGADTRPGKNSGVWADHAAKAPRELPKHLIFEALMKNEVDMVEHEGTATEYERRLEEARQFAASHGVADEAEMADDIGRWSVKHGIAVIMPDVQVTRRARLHFLWLPSGEEPYMAKSMLELVGRVLDSENIRVLYVSPTYTRDGLAFEAKITNTGLEGTENE